MILLDTFTLLRLVLDPSQLSQTATRFLSDPTETRHVSAITAFEIGTLVKKSRITLSSKPDVWFAEALVDYSVSVIPVSWAIALQSTELPPIHSDPADRIILATALVGGMPVISPDRHFPSYPNVKVIW